MACKTRPPSYVSSCCNTDSTSSLEIITESQKTALKTSVTKMFPEKPRIANCSSGQSLDHQKREERKYHEFFLTKSTGKRDVHGPNGSEEHRTVPLFSGTVLDCSRESTFSQFGLLAGEIPKARPVDLLGSTAPATPRESQEEDRRIFLNVSPPWSSFICGSQGSGKSHTLSCMIEDCLIASELGKLPNPLTGLVFHYDKFSSYSGNQLCEVAYLCSSGIPVKVLVSKTNEFNMRQKYSELPGLPKDSPKPEVLALAFRDSQLDVSKMMTLMAVSDKDGPAPLYVETIMRILRQMAIVNKGQRGLDYARFRQKLEAEGFTTGQSGPLKLRLDLLESMMDRSPIGDKIEEKKHKHAWEFNPGGLTIVDLSCPFVDENAACALFKICLEIFLEDRGNTGRVVALDEAHKFMTSAPSAVTFTDTLLDIIRQQRHLATRVIIATQEPTISPKLLDLASMTIVHRFTSPEWFRSLQGHLAGISGDVIDGEGGESDGSMSNAKSNVGKLFSEIVHLDAGEALLFCPSAMLRWEADLADENIGNGERGTRKTSIDDSYQEQELDGGNILMGGTKGVKDRGKPIKLGMRYTKIRVRQRLTADGGKSVMAT